MRKRLALVLAFQLLGLVFAWPAGAHTVTGPSLSCNQLDFSYADFASGVPITLAWSTVVTQVVTTQGPSGAFSVSPPVVPPGTRLSVTGTWTFDGGGSFSAAAIMYCTPPPAASPGPAGPPGPPGPPGPSARAAHRVLLRESDVREWIESRPAVAADRPGPGRKPRRRPPANGKTAPGSAADLREIERNLTR